MTNKEVEIANKALSIVKRLERGSYLSPQAVGQMIDDVVALVHEAKIEAYKEAAQKAKDFRQNLELGEWTEGNEWDYASQTIATRILALRDSLVETVSSCVK